MSLMLSEVMEIPEVLQRMLDDDQGVREMARRWLVAPPTLFLSVARGSSAHAADYVHHVIMSQMGVPAFPVSMALLNLDCAPLQLAGACALGFSQSGESPDLVNGLSYLQGRGATVMAIVNTPGSPLAAVADHSLLLPAGKEVSVAATKSCMAMMMAGVQAVAHFRYRKNRDSTLLEALARLPERMHRAIAMDWSAAQDVLLAADRTLVIGRGASLSMAREAALKLQETSAIQSGCYSSAEVRHGPMEIIAPDYPLLVFAAADTGQAQTLKFAHDMHARGAGLLLAAPAGTPLANLPIAAAGHPLLEPFTIMQSFYLMAQALAVARGRDPDQPRFLGKVTLTH